MKNLQKISQQLKKRRAKRIRAKVIGQPERPRLAVFRSLKHISVQAIDDLNGLTLAAAFDKEVKAETKLAQAEAVGELIARRLIDKKINRAIFDKRHYRYHGLVKSLADGARKGGLEF